MGADLSAFEQIKLASRFLRGSIVEGLADPVTGAVSEADAGLLKFHGSYLQDDRDIREERRRQKLEPAHAFMLRARLPGGVITPAQWFEFDRLAREFADGSLRITSRQTLQWHGILKGRLKPVIAAIHQVLATTIAACGDVVRTVVCTANPVESVAHGIAYAWAERLSRHLEPHARAYHEIWLDDKKLVGEEESEPLYGPTYLPRKFKIGLAIPPLNDIDVLSQDLGLIAIIDRGVLTGFNVSVGGGMGVTHNDSSTYPRLASVIGFVDTQNVLALAEAVIGVQRDWGDRTDRRHARLKYTIDRHGLSVFRKEVERRLGHTLASERTYRFEHNGDRYGWIEAHDGLWHLTLHIESGRLSDDGECRLLSGMRALAQVHRGDFRLTCNQNVIVAGIAEQDRAHINAIVRKYGLDGHHGQSGLRLHALACVALPTCGLAMAEAERYLPSIVNRMERLLDRHGLFDAPISLRISGCPNGCSRPYLAEIALVGRGPGRYDLHLGADFRGQRLNRLVRQNIDEQTVLDVLDPLLNRYASERESDEGFGDFLIRTGLIDSVATVLPLRAGDA